MDNILDTGWYVVARWPSGKVSLITETFWTSASGGRFAANEKAAAKLDYLLCCQKTGKPSIYGTVLPDTRLSMQHKTRPWPKGA